MKQASGGNADSWSGLAPADVPPTGAERSPAVPRASQKEEGAEVHYPFAMTHVIGWFDENQFHLELLVRSGRGCKLKTLCFPIAERWVMAPDTWVTRRPLQCLLPHGNGSHRYASSTDATARRRYVKRNKLM